MWDDCLAFLCFLRLVDRKTKSKEDCDLQKHWRGQYRREVLIPATTLLEPRALSLKPHKLGIKISSELYSKQD